jgi:hypothetical protein
MILQANPGFYLIYKGKRSDIIGWQIDEDEDGAISQPVPITVFGMSPGSVVQGPTPLSLEYVIQKTDVKDPLA